MMIPEAAIRRIGLRTAVAVVVLGLTVGGASAAVSVKLALIPTTKAPNAKGQTHLVVRRGSQGKFVVLAKRLAPNATFDVIVAGVKVGTLVTNPGGAGKLKFSSKPNRSEAFLGFDPRGAQVVVRDDVGDDDLVGDEPPGDSATGACCLPDHEGESECEDLSAADCTSAGGAPSTATSCLPDPCTTTPPPAPILCCLPGSARGAFTDEDPEVECEDVNTAGECTTRGGTVVQGSTCDPNPCTATPPPTIVACCVPDGSETECEELTPEACTAQQGSASSAASCDADPCGGGDGGSGGGDDGGHP
ncbi:MAG TPA: hypothetical protein VKW76_13490 [Candidatus Binatia bacterium]|nr:hypothetical protein [Candidatus Binatia bacterium]